MDANFSINPTGSGEIFMKSLSDKMILQGLLMCVGRAKGLEFEAGLCLHCQSVKEGK